ncbi:hypothetical protein HAX54_041154, partial [Datura stramonium]|nr:hypothetical protein [Datura stramonium]
WSDVFLKGKLSILRALLLLCGAGEFEYESSSNFYLFFYVWEEFNCHVSTGKLSVRPSETLNEAQARAQGFRPLSQTCVTLAFYDLRLGKRRYLTRRPWKSKYSSLVL